MKLFSARRRLHTNVDLHSHTRGSDGTGTPAAIALAARAAGLHFLALTDHHTSETPEVLAVADALVSAGVLPIIGAEYSTKQNHLLVYGIPVRRGEWGMYPDMQDVVDDVNRRGGVCVVPHPHKGYSRAIKDGVEAIRGLAAVETLNGQVEWRSPDTNRKAAANAARMRAPQTGASDAHVPEDIGSTFTRFKGHLTTVGDVLAALRRGTGFAPARNEAIFAKRHKREADRNARAEQQSRSTFDWSTTMPGRFYTQDELWTEEES